MPSNSVPSDFFENYFYTRAQLADSLESSGHRADAYTLATASLDALAMIWLHDFPDTKKKLESELGGNVPSSIRLARLLKRFVPGDPDVNKVAVICFAQDWKNNRPKEAQIADQLLSKRISDDPDELPRAYLDVSRFKLAQECPELNSRPDLFSLAEWYEYGALLYTFYRCPLVHAATTSKRAHRFARREEIMYYWSSDNDRVTIGFGLNLVTRWLRNIASSYVQTCQQLGVVPAEGIDVDIEQEERLKARWGRLK